MPCTGVSLSSGMRATPTLLFEPPNPKSMTRALTLRHLFSSSSLISPRVLCVAPRSTDQRRRNSNNSSAPLIEKKKEMQFNRKRAEGRDGTTRKNLQLKLRKLNPINTICYLQILGTGMDTQDTSPSVLLFFDKQRIIFNAGEGLQRFCTEHKIKLSKIDHMFLTRVCSETASGLPGLLLTLAGIGDEGMSVNVWGPSDLKFLVGAMKSFIPHAAMVHTHSFGEMTNEHDLSSSNCVPSRINCEPFVLVDDDVVQISAILLYPKYSSRLEKNGYSPVKMKSDLKPGDVAVIYACELPEIKGKFDPSKAASLGLKPGPKYRELQLGNSVRSDQQDIMVHPSDVLDPPIPGPIILLVDCPTEFHFSELQSLQSLNCYYSSLTSHQPEGSKNVNCVIHLGPDSVTSNADYKIWMRRFGSAKHILAGHETRNIEVPVLRSSARVTSRLNYLCPQFFPFLQHNESQQTSISSCEESCETISAENLLKFHLRPYALLGLDRSAIPASLSTSEIVKELLSEIPEIAAAANEVKLLWKCYEKARSMQLSTSKTNHMVEEPWMDVNAEITDTLSKDMSLVCNLDIPSCLEDVNREDMEIVFLGTGSSQPSKYRNVSSIYVNLFSKGSILLDCGEGTLGQLKRRFGVKGADDALRALRLVWISHIHADHHVGIARILALRCALLRDMHHEPLLVIGPRPLKRFLDAYSQLEDLDMQFLDCRHTTEASWNSITVSIPSTGDSSSEDVDESCSQNTVPQSVRNTIFAKCDQMQSYWKRPGSPADISIVRPLLTKLKEVLEDAGLDILYSVPVVHCPQAFGVVLKSSERTNCNGKVIPGWKLVYSADTRPCQAIIDASQDATVLIHEATFEDGMEDEAIAKNHSTTMEAIRVGTTSGAYRIVLTHFSQRYPKIPIFDEAHMDKTCIAFDMMNINLADLPILPKVLPFLKLLFKNEMAMEADDAATVVSNN